MPRMCVGSVYSVHIRVLTKHLVEAELLGSRFFIALPYKKMSQNESLLVQNIYATLYGHGSRSSYRETYKATDGRTGQTGSLACEAIKL